MSRRTLNYSELIKESAEDLCRLLAQKSQSVRIQERLKFLHLLKTGACLTQQSAGEGIGLSGRQGQNLWRIYQKEGLEGLRHSRYKGGNNRRITADQDAEVLARLDKDDLISQSQIQAYIHQTFQVKYSASGISRKLRRLGAKAKTGRPVNVRKDVVGEVEFKKNSKN